MIEWGGADTELPVTHSEDGSEPDRAEGDAREKPTGGMANPGELTPMSLGITHVAWRSAPFLAAVLAASSAFAHPGSGIVVDREGRGDFVGPRGGVSQVALPGRV